MGPREIIDNYYNELRALEKSGEFRTNTYYAGVRLDINEAVCDMVKCKDLYHTTTLTEYIKRGTLLMELADSMRRDMGNHADRLLKAAGMIVKEEDPDMWKRIQQKAKEMK